MWRDTVVTAPKRAEVDSPSIARGESASDAPDARTRRAYYMALGKLALQNARDTLGWCVDALRFPNDRGGDDSRHPDTH